MNTPGTVPTRATVTDGRVRRGIRTHTKIVESLLDLISSGVEEPTAHQIATEAGVSVRTIFQHFNDMEALYADLVRAQTVRFTPLFESLETDGDFERRLTALGVQRRELYEAILPIRRVVSRKGIASPVVTERLATVATALRGQILSQFAPELGWQVGVDPDASDPTRRRSPGVAATGDQLDAPWQVEALDLIWSFESWDRLRSTQSLTPEAAEQMLVDMTRSLFC